MTTAFTEPAVVEIEPTPHRTDGEGSGRGIEFIGGSRHPGAALNLGIRDNRLDNPAAFRLVQRHERTADKVEQGEMRHLVC